MGRVWWRVSWRVDDWGKAVGLEVARLETRLFKGRGLGPHSISLHMAEPSTDYYKQKTWCDAKDGLGVWRLGRVKKRQKNNVLVHFDGWSDKWKQWHCIHSNMLAPLRMHSQGYTGQTKIALREWDFNEEYLKIVSGKLRILLHNKFEGFSPYDLSVLLRGDLFVLVDCLLTYTYSV